MSLLGDQKKNVALCLYAYGLLQPLPTRLSRLGAYFQDYSFLHYTSMSFLITITSASGTCKPSSSVSSLCVPHNGVRIGETLRTMKLSDGSGKRCRWRHRKNGYSSMCRDSTYNTCSAHVVFPYSLIKEAWGEKTHVKNKRFTTAYYCTIAAAYSNKLVEHQSWGPKPCLASVHCSSSRSSSLCSYTALSRVCCKAWINLTLDLFKLCAII